MTPPRDNGSIASQVLLSFAKSGPWALLVLLILGWLGWQTQRLLDKTGEAVTNYVVTSTAATKDLMNSVEELAASRETTLEAVKLNAALLGSNAQAIKLSIEKTEEMLELMRKAYEMMKETPQQRREQIQLLQKIEAGIAELAVKIEEAKTP